MLRQALDAAGTQEDDQLMGVEPLPGSASGETDSLLPDSNTQQNYASYSATSNADNTDSSDDGESRSQAQSYDDDEEWQEAWRKRHQNGPAPVQVGLVEKTLQKVKGYFFLVLNVENLWDSPTASVSDRQVVSRKNHCVVLFWFFILAASYASERSAFKLLVDRTGPFRLFTVEVITFSHALIVGLGMLISAIARRNFSMKPLGIPIVDIGRKLFFCGLCSTVDCVQQVHLYLLTISSVMALLDTIHILLVFLTGLNVPPTLTVILVQFTLPLTALLTQFVHTVSLFSER